MITVTPSITIPDEELELRYVRSSGPGGQNVNKLSTKAVLRWNVVASESVPEPVKQRFVDRYRRRITAGGEIVLSSQRHRHQARNAEDCRQRLRAMLHAVVQPPRPRKPTKVPRRAVEARLRDKRERSEKKGRRKSGGWDDN